MGLRDRIRLWWLARMPAQNQIDLNQRNVYILPTKAGLMLGATTLLLLVSSINYQLNLGYVLTFLLAGSALAAMHAGHAMLRGLELRLQAPEPVYAGDSVLVTLQLSNSTQRERFSVGASWRGQDHAAWVNLPRQSRTSLALRVPALRRGEQTLPTIMIHTRYPMGCFRVWAYWRPEHKVWVYPRPEPNVPPLPLVQNKSANAGARAARTGAGDPEDLRPYRQGDPPKAIAWKKVAHSGDLVSRDFETGQHITTWLSLDQTGLSAREAQLSRLCAWVLKAENSGQSYGLRLPATAISPGRGQAHMHQCLLALAGAG